MQKRYIISVLLGMMVITPKVSAVMSANSSTNIALQPSIFISVTKTEFSSEEEIYLDLKIGNKSRIPLYIPVPNPNGYLCRIIITDKKNGGSAMLKYPAGPWKNVSYRPFRIQSGMPFDSKISAGKLKPGRYSVQVRYESSSAFGEQGMWTGSVDSNVVEFLVVKPMLEKELAAKEKAALTAEFAGSDAKNDRKMSFIRQISSWFQHIEMDRNGDGKPDLWEDLVRKIIIRDADFNGVPDTWDYFKNGRLFRSGYDTDGDGMPDVFQNQ